jgi:hypothetical protein
MNIDTKIPPPEAEGSGNLAKRFPDLSAAGGGILDGQQNIEKEKPRWSRLLKISLRTCWCAAPEPYIRAEQAKSS